MLNIVISSRVIVVAIVLPGTHCVLLIRPSYLSILHFTAYASIERLYAPQVVFRIALNIGVAVGVEHKVMRVGRIMRVFSAL